MVPLSVLDLCPTVEGGTAAPSESRSRPYVMLGVNVVAADTQDQARSLAASGRQSFASLRAGHPIQLPPPSKEWEPRVHRAN